MRNLSPHRRSLCHPVGLFSAVCFVLAAADTGAVPPPDHRGEVRGLGRIPAPITTADFPNPSADLVALGKVLFYDKILSGNRNIACATCHHGLTGTGDGLSLPVGEGGSGLGVARNTGSGLGAIHERVPRNAPPLFNLGAFEFTEMFHDKRLEADPDFPSGFRSPAGDDLPEGLDSALAVQAMFPVTSADEMAGQPGENSVADAAAIGNLAGPDGVWAQLADRLRAIPEYVELFSAAFAEVDDASDISYVHAAKAIAAYENLAFRAINSPFDRFLRGDRRALSRAATRGMFLFYGRAGCADCHSGPLLTDHDVHAIAMPQIGPGKGDGVDGLGDLGRGRETGLWEDNYKFRTPALRNTALTGPWGHDGAYDTLDAVVRHHLRPVTALEDYNTDQARLPLPEPSEWNADLAADDFSHHRDAANRAAIAAANELQPIRLTEWQLRDLMAFLHSLTDPASLDLRDTVPARVPSGIPLAD
jgi:cytochrome c peroxidase